MRTSDDMLRIRRDMDAIAVEIDAVLARPPVDRLRDGISVVIGGPPNSGKSTMLNRLAQREAAIVTPISGTTRDRIDVPVSRNGIFYVLADTAGLTRSDDPVEAIGVERAAAAIRQADILLWMGDETPPRDAIWVHGRADLPGRGTVPSGRDVAVGLGAPDGLAMLWTMIERQANAMLPREDDIALHTGQRERCAAAVAAMADPSTDPIIVAEMLRSASRSLGEILGRDSTQLMLSVLFARFCVGK